MSYIIAFLVGGVICALVQILMEKTKMLKVIADYDDNPVDVTAEVNFTILLVIVFIKKLS